MWAFSSWPTFTTDALISSPHKAILTTHSVFQYVYVHWYGTTPQPTLPRDQRITEDMNATL